MHWILTRPRDTRGAELVELLERTGTPHDVVAGGASFGTIVPDVSPEGPVLCLGSYALRHVAVAKGWSPGVIDVGWLGYRESIEAWGDAMLNADARFCRLDALAETASTLGSSRVFVRPAYDSKVFEALVLDVGDVAGWAGTLSPPPAPETFAMACRPKEVLAEWRTWIVDGRVATASLYRRGGKALFDGRDLPGGMLAFAGDAAAILAGRLGADAPAAYVLDVALVAEGYRIVEVNGISGARFYDCDVNLLFGALDGLGCAYGAGGPDRIVYPG